jgi:hypothetical protein
MLEGLFQPMHLLVALVVAVPVFLVCRLLYRWGSK